MTERGSRAASLTAPAQLRKPGRLLAVVGIAPALLLLAHLLPETGPGLALRLGAAAACVLLLPGALLLRALGWPSSPGVAVAASFALSLVILALGLAIVFLVGGSILVAAGVLAVVSALSAVASARRPCTESVSAAERRALGGALAGGVAVAGMVWWAAGPLFGDALFHLARARKLAEFDVLNTLTTVDEFKDGGLHPGYAFPLWQAVDALVARLAGVDVTSVILYLPAILVPLAFLLAYGAGAAVFRSWVGGLALVLAQAAQVGLSRRDPFFEGTGLFETLSQPQAASRLLLTPAIIALAFAFIVEGGWILLAALTAAALALSAIHPSYAPYVALVFGGFLVARAVLARGWDLLLTRSALALGALLVPFGFLLVLLLPIVRDTRAFTPSTAQSPAGKGFTLLGDWFGYSPAAIAREGPVVVAGLLAVPLAALAARRLWSAFVLGGSLAVLTVLLAPPLFTALSDAFSVSQSRRLAGFIPIAFAVAGACIVSARLRALGVALAAGAGVAFVLLYPGEFVRRVEAGGPEWAVLVALAGGLAALVAGAVLRPLGPDPGAWAVAVAGAFVLPVAVAGVFALQRAQPVIGLTPGIIAAVREQVPRGEVVFSDPETAYEVAAFAPVYVNAAPLANVADTEKNRPRARIRDARRFFSRRPLTDAERRAILAGYGADWLLVDRKGPEPPGFLRTLVRVFEDGRYALYRVRP